MTKHKSERRYIRITVKYRAGNKIESSMCIFFFTCM